MGSAGDGEKDSTRSTARGDVRAGSAVAADVRALLEETEQRSRDREAFFDAVLGSTHDGFLVFDLERRCTFANVAALRLTGGTLEQALGRTAEELCHDAAAARDRCERALRGEVTVSERSVSWLAPDGRRIWLTGTWAPLRDAKGEIVGALTTQQDVTERELAVERERQNESLTALGRLVGGVAHDIRNPLFGISATLEAFEAKFGDLPEHRPYVQTMRSELTSMTTLVDELLDYGRPARATLERGSVQPPLEAAVRNTAALALARGVRVQLTIEPGVRDAAIDATRLGRLFTNLLDNAIRFAPTGTNVEARVLSDRASVHVTIEDRGAGFPPDELVDAFEPFVSRRSGGTGLGLAIARRIAEQHAGSIRASNRSGGGASIELDLPTVGGDSP